MAKRKAAIYWLVPFLVGMAVLMWQAIGLDAKVHGHDFMQNGWLPAKLIQAGDNPYWPNQPLVHQFADAYLLPIAEGDTEFNSGGEYNAIYPYWSLLAQTPLGWLDFPTAMWLWAVLCGAMLLGGVFLVAGAARRNWALEFGLLAWAAALLLLGVVAMVYAPSLLHFYLGQHSVIIFLLLAALFALPDDSGWLGPVLLALATMKPQLSGLIIALVLLVWIGWRQWRQVAIWLSVMAVLYLLPLVFAPSSLGDWLNVSFVAQKQSTRLAPASSSWWGMAYHWAHGLGGAWWLVAAVLSLLTLLLLYRPLRQALRDGDWQQLVPLAIIVTLLVTPYTIAYDQVLLLLPAIWLGLRLQAVEGRLAMLVRLALLLWATLLPLLLAVATVEYTQSNYIKFLQTLALLGLHYLTAYALAADDEMEEVEVAA